MLRVYLDMDEVLADFVGGVCRCWGLHRDQVEREWEQGSWDMVPPLGRALCAAGKWDGAPFGPREFWAAIAAHPAFWATLGPLPWVPELLTLLQEQGALLAYRVVTALPQDLGSYAAKVQWLAQLLHVALPVAQRLLVPLTDKHLLAQPDALLLDDRDQTVSDFIAAGGMGIVFPTHHNSQWAHKAAPLAYVRERLARALT